MSRYSAIKAATNAYIKTNGRQEITGAILNAVMIATIDSLGKFYQFVGYATPDTMPGNIDQNIAYIAGTAGTYTNLGGFILASGEIAILKFDGEWKKETICSIPSRVSELSNDLGFITKQVSDLVNYYTIGEIDSRLDAIIGQTYVVSWDGASEPVVDDIPLGVSVIYGGDTYVGTLVPSSSTDRRIYLVSNGTGYDEYISTDNGGYAWIPFGSTALDLSGYATTAQLSDVIDDLGEVRLFATRGYGEEQVTPTTITNLQIKTSGSVISSSTSSNDCIYYVPVEKGQHLFYSASTGSSAVLRYAFSKDTPAEDVEIFDIVRTATTSEELDLLCPFDGFFVVYHLSGKFTDQEFGIGTQTILSKRVSALEESSAETEKFLDGTESDETSLFISGYYNMSDKVEGDTMRTLSSSDTLYTARVRVRSGQIIRCNTQASMTNTVRPALVTDENVIVSFPTKSMLHIGFSMSNAEVAAGGAYLVIPYRSTTQIEPIYLKVIDTYKFVKVQLSESDGVTLYRGKTAILCGDSQLGQSQGVDTFIQEIVGGTILNCGFGGARMSWRTNDGSNQWDAFSMVNIADCLSSGNFTSMEGQAALIETYPYFATAINKLKSVSMGDGKDIVLTIAYGGNDFSGGASIGDVNVESKTTYLGALAYVARVLLTAFPRLVILLVGIPYRVYEYETIDGHKVIISDSDTYTRSDGLHRYAFNDALLDGAKVLKLPGFDMYRRSGRNKYNVFTLCPTDGVHPTSIAGKKAQAEVYSKILQSF